MDSSVAARRFCLHTGVVGNGRLVVRCQECRRSSSITSSGMSCNTVVLPLSVFVLHWMTVLNMTITTITTVATVVRGRSWPG